MALGSDKMFMSLTGLSHEYSTMPNSSQYTSRSLQLFSKNTYGSTPHRSNSCPCAHSDKTLYWRKVIRIMLIACTPGLDQILKSAASCSYGERAVRRTTQYTLGMCMDTVCPYGASMDMNTLIALMNRHTFQNNRQATNRYGQRQ